MGINFGGTNTTRWYAGVIAAKPNVTGDFTAMVVSTCTTATVSKHQHFLSMKGAGWAGSFTFTSEDVTWGVKWFGNVLLSFSYP